MEAVVLNLMWALECLMIMICLHIAYTQKFRLNIRLLGIMVCNNGLFMLHYWYGLIPKVCAYAGYILLFLYFCGISRKKFLNKILRFVFGILLAGVIEIGVTLVILIVFSDVKDTSAIKMLVGAVISLLFSEIIYLFCSKIELEVADKQNGLILLGFSSACIFILLDYWVYNVMNVLQDLVIGVLCVGVFLYVTIVQKKNKEVEMRDLELAMHKMYGEAYEELQVEVRKLQHDYKNQIATLQSMPLAAASLDELIELQEAYGSQLERNNKYEQIMTCCNNPILAGYLYYKCRDLERIGIKVAYKLSVMDAECKMRLHELIEVLGILLDNGEEYLVKEKIENRKMYLELLEGNDKIKLKVSNQAEIYTNEELSRFFQKGYSTKGENRGIGLYRVKELAEKYNGELLVFNGKRGEENWLDISLKIRK